MATTWGPIEKAVTHGKTVSREDGAVTQPHVSGGDAPHHTVDYNATDSRHNYERGMRPWKSVDSGSGECTPGEWDHVSHAFPDGPGPWRQT